MARPLAQPDVFTAIAQPHRRAILTVLARETSTVTALVDAVGLSQSTVSEHLKALRSVGLVKSSPRGRHRIYAFEPAPLGEVADWLGTLEAFWDDRFARLETTVASLEKAGEQ